MTEDEAFDILHAKYPQADILVQKYVGIELSTPEKPEWSSYNPRVKNTTWQISVSGPDGVPEILYGFSAKSLEDCMADLRPLYTPAP